MSSAKMCSECGTRLDPSLTESVHPGCWPEVVASFRALDRRKREGQRLAEAGKRRALRNQPQQAQTGLELIRLAAVRNEFLSADELRDTFEAAGINLSKAAGGLWSAAIKAGYVKPISEAPSGGVSAHGKKINRYQSLIYILRRAS